MPTLRRTVTLTAVAAVTAGLTQLAPLPASVGTVALPSAPAPASGGVDRTLGGGLGRLLAQEQPAARSAPGAGGLEVDQESLAIRDDEGRVLVQIAAAEGEDPAALSRQAAGLGFVETADDEATGLVEGFVPLSSVEAMAALPALGTIAQVPRPVTRGGRTTYQGVPFQRVNRVLRRGVDGEGITVGVISDSYDTSTEIDGEPIATRAADDVRSGDLPGRGNPDGYTQPVVVLEDSDLPGVIDEGRAMLQIIHDTAPAARLCFATANNGEVGFADNIRALADPQGRCRADIVVDDIGYFSSPFFSDDVIGRAVEDVVADGVSYFSAAGNNGLQNAWRSPVDLVPRSGVRAAARAAGLDLRGVDPALYAGGLQDMSTGTGTDVAQTLRLDPDGGVLNVKWSDPFDVDGADVGEPVLDDAGRLTRANTRRGVDFGFRVTGRDVGRDFLVTVDGVPSGSTDVVLTVNGPGGQQSGPVDTGSSPESTSFTAQRAGRYTATVSGFEGATGRFTIDAVPVLGPSETTTDFAVLLFDRQGEFLGAVDESNRLTGRPSEISPVSLSATKPSTVQLVLSRVSTGQTPVQEIGYINYFGVYTDEYVDPTAPAIYGQATAEGAVAVAALDSFRPYLSQPYTSPGGAMNFYFDDGGERLARPEVRQKPDVASTDGGNTTFFAGQGPDGDDFPNFFGTSAAAPQAAAIAALMLDQAGGPRSLTPAQVETTMQRTAFRHDLDPFHASGAAGGVTVFARGYEGEERSASPGSVDDRNVFRVRYDGPQALRSLTLLARSASPTALGRRPGTGSGGMVFDPRPLAPRGRYQDGGFPFTVGSVSPGIATRSITGRVTRRVASSPFYRRLRLTFSDPLTKGQGVGFGIDRDLRFPSPPRGGNAADHLGGAVSLPSGRGSAKGMGFVAVLTDGTRITGRLENRLGRGFSPVDGHGPVDAYAAVFGGR